MEKKYLVEESYLTSIADIIRNKTGLTNKLTFPDEFFEEIRNIETSPVTALPVLDMNYPEDIIVMEGANVSASFSVIISEPGIPAIYTYQWYENGNPIEGATSAIYNKTTDFVVGNYSVYCEITNEAGSITSRIATLTVTSKKPTYSYTGSANLITDDSDNYRIKFLTSGILNFSNLGCLTDGIDVFCVGGGGGGGNSGIGGGGGGGYTTTMTGLTIKENTDYTITVGAGGSAGVKGGSSSAFDVTANGGNTTSNNNGASGGSGGGGSIGDNSPNQDYGGSGGSNGGNGGRASGGANNSAGSGGQGQGSTTREFGENSGTLYAGGGGGNGQDGVGSGGSGGGGKGGGPGYAGTTNLGGGGGTAAAGGSGIVVIRNHRS